MKLTPTLPISLSRRYILRIASAIPQAVVFFATLLVVACGGASGPENSRTITVTGRSEVRFVPDEVVVTLGVETLNPSLQTSLKENDERTTRVLALAQSFKMEPWQVQTSQFTVGQETEYSERHKRHVFVAYAARKRIEVVMRDPSRLQELTAEALKAGANQVYGIEFRSSAPRTHRDQARTLAIQAAKEKAEALASALGQRVGRARTITEGSPSDSWGNFNANRANFNPVSVPASGGSDVFRAEPGSVAIGVVSVQAEVSVVFDLD